MSWRNVAVSVRHGEEIRPDADDYSELFAALAAEGCTFHTSGTGEGCGALVIGAPARSPSEAELAEVRAWIEGGGRLLAVAGDDAGWLRALIPELAFGERIAGLPSSVCGDELWDGVAGVAIRAAAPLLWSVPADGLSGPGDAFVTDAHLAAKVAIGAGHAVVVCTPAMLANGRLRDDDTYGTWTDALIRHWLVPFADEVARRMSRPQRHRLLQAFPMAPAMHRVEPVSGRALMTPARVERPAADRAAVVGVLPHPYCNPAVRGCGFCTFPHESYARDAAERVGAHVVAEIAAFRTRLSQRRHPDWPRRPVEAVYLGGGTANLTPPDTLRAIGAALADAFVLDDAEVTFEGVPIYFVARKPRPLDLLQEIFPAARHRVSLGIQTFDPAQLERMGRTAFGDAAAFAHVVAEAHKRGFTTSADLLFNLPGQSQDQILADARAAADIGLEQICFYHLVMFDGLDTDWSRDRSLLARLPDHPRAVDNWLALRDTLLGLGYVQTSLTDFERADALADPHRRFRYEPCVFAPERYDQLGFGPSAVTFWGARNAITWKHLNPTGADAYLAADPAWPWERDFAYGWLDWQVLYLTRKIAALGVDRAAYTALFNRDPLVEHGLAFAALADAGLVTIAPDRIAVTPRGMFYADTIAGLLAWRRMQTFKLHDRRSDTVTAARTRDLDNEASFNWMG